LREELNVAYGGAEYRENKHGGKSRFHGFRVVVGGGKVACYCNRNEYLPQFVINF
jgi:hypothetical protein